MQNNEEKPVEINDEYSKQIVEKIITEIEDYETTSIQLSDRVSFSQRQTVQDIITHQNKGFLTPLAVGQDDDRIFYDIVSPMIETGVSNTDLDTDNIEPYVDNPKYIAHEYVARTKLRNFHRQTTQGIALNEMEYQFYDDGNIVVRKVDNGEIYRPVLPQNLYVIDQSARTLEDTTVIEKQLMNQTEVRDMKGWDNKDKVFAMCQASGNLPYYEIFYRYGEISKMELGYIKQEVHNIPYEFKEGDDNEYIQSVVIMAKATTDEKDEQDNDIKGIPVFAEELIPEVVKITRKLEFKRYKPYESVGLGKFNGRFWREGYREIAMPYQTTANEIANKLRKIMEYASIQSWWSDDETLLGKNILSSVKRGQIIILKQGKTLSILNNTFPNFSLFVEEWNRNITECTKALKAFEVASGESLPSSTSATGIAVQNQAVGKYFNFKRERFGLFLTVIYSRWILPELLKIEKDEDIELIGDISEIESIIDACANGWMIKNYLKTIALTGGVINKQDYDQLKEIKKQELLKNQKNYLKIFKDFFKEVELFVGINTTGEGFNKQAKISNMIQLLQYELNPQITGNPGVMDTINDIRQMLGLKPIKQAPETKQAIINSTPQNQGNMPMKEQSLQENGSDAMPNML